MPGPRGAAKGNTAGLPALQALVIYRERSHGTNNNKSDERKLKNSTNGEVQGALEDLGNCSPNSDFKICITHSLKCSFLWSHIIRIRETWLQSAVDCLEKNICLIFLKLNSKHWP